MKKIVMSFALAVLCTLGVNAQAQGDWYIGTGDIADIAWTEWSIAPTVGYGVTDNLMVGMNVSQEDSTADMQVDLHARYFINTWFLYVETAGLNTDDLKVGAGKMFTFHKGVFVDPKVVYDLSAETVNLTLGVGLKF
tara:strand:- start:3614 stop:4024 length:411 start_codon:yes stop_codon:yes gene_type:complete